MTGTRNGKVTQPSTEERHQPRDGTSETQAANDETGTNPQTTPQQTDNPQAGQPSKLVGAVQTAPRPQIPSGDRPTDPEERQRAFINSLPHTVRITRDPEKYAPSDDAARWIKQYETAALQNNWDEAFRIQTVDLYTTGAAIQWAENMQGRWATWKDSKRAFLRRFDIGKAAEAKLRLRRLLWDEDRPLLDHLEHVHWLCFQVDNRMLDEEIIEYFGNSIPEAEFSDVAAAGATPTTGVPRSAIRARARPHRQTHPTGPSCSGNPDARRPPSHEKPRPNGKEPLRSDPSTPSAVPTKKRLTVWSKF